MKNIACINLLKQENDYQAVILIQRNSNGSDLLSGQSVVNDPEYPSPFRNAI